MTARDFLDKQLSKAGVDVHIVDIDPVTSEIAIAKEDVIEIMIKYAKRMCYEQKMLCLDNATTHVVDSFLNLSTQDVEEVWDVDCKSITDAPYPKFSETTP